MEFNKTKVEVAAALVPLAKWLYKAGVLSIHGHEGKVQVSEAFFRETFPVYEVRERNSREYPYELYYTYEGVEFITITEGP